MKVLLWIAAAACLAGAPALYAAEHAQHGAQHTAGASYDLQFLDSMAKHHQAAIDMAKLAPDRAAQAAARRPEDSGQQNHHRAAPRDCADAAMAAAVMSCVA